MVLNNGKIEQTKKELEERIKKLEKENKELHRRVRELKRFQRLGVGRELRMVELKKELEELKNK